jgi:hypothetical protein
MLGLTHDFDQCKEFAGRDSLPGICSATEAARHKEMNINFCIALKKNLIYEISPS